MMTAIATIVKITVMKFLPKVYPCVTRVAKNIRKRAQTNPMLVISVEIAPSFVVRTLVSAVEIIMSSGSGASE